MSTEKAFNPTRGNIQDLLALFELGKDPEALDQWIDGLIALAPAPSQAARLSAQVICLRLFGAAIQGAFTPSKGIKS